MAKKLRALLLCILIPISTTVNAGPQDAPVIAIGSGAIKAGFAVAATGICLSAVLAYLDANHTAYMMPAGLPGHIIARLTWRNFTTGLFWTIPAAMATTLAYGYFRSS